MVRTVKRVALALVASIAMVGVVPAGTAFAMNEVNCANNNDFLWVSVHWASGPNVTYCFANAGTVNMRDKWGRPGWLVRFWTGNNTVQWHGDGRWQPSSAVGKWTTYEFPNHPGGVQMDSISIL
ncbi:hypothetical protein ALI144C_17975 [Actinosynnema sp. ALI-1.44]|uniref:hypothetical protein n=1 Tax=Actinosynnema sp. ALI-1.44 TaxID=1933779 RepID=UPI00097C4280|nr:hypothetical protein [Actinosynnema sp. ALI-1.44]ONI82943.1 hypothetical protein ALI144C_17975 [Actinosynnema sp. ALI-1.44]